MERSKTNFKRISIFILTVIFTLITSFYFQSDFNVSAANYSVIFPVNNGCKIFRYQKYDPQYKNHDGVDIHSSGNDTIYAAKAGTVVSTCNSCSHQNMGSAHKGKYNEEGNYIAIKGTDGIYYWYYHLKQNTLLVSKGSKVSAGQPIATMGSSGISTGKHLHFRMTTGSSYSSSAIIANPVGTYNGQVNYSNGPYPNPNNYVAITQGDYYLKNSSTGTYLNISGGKATNGQAAVLSAKQNSNSFKFYASGSKENGYYLLSLIDKNYALNPYSDTPGDGTKITLYKKSTDGTQLYFFEKSGNGYIIHNAYNQNLVLTPSGSNVLLKTKTGAANQVWVLESANTTTVKFHRNLNSEDTNAVSEKFTVGVANQKFGYNTDGTGRYGTMNAADVGFGQWTNPGYKLLGWSTNKNAATSSWGTYSSVTDNWIKNNAPSVDLYAVWQKIEISTIVKFHRNTNNDDDTTVSEKFTVGVANQKFGYNTDGTGRYETMNAADVGFGQWTNPGYKLLGWSTDKNATTSSWGTYSSVTDYWIKNNAPSVDLYAVWQKKPQLGDLNDDKKVSVTDIALLQKYLVRSGKLTETQQTLADMNGDKKINVFDLIILKREVLKIS